MSDAKSGSEQPMIPDELVPRQQSEDPIPGDPSATESADDEDEGGAEDRAR